VVSLEIGFAEAASLVDVVDAGSGTVRSLGCSGVSATAPVAYDDQGDGSALVLLHGHPFDRSMWAPQREQLSDEFRVVALDLPGYGASPQRRDPRTDYSTSLRGLTVPALVIAGRHDAHASDEVVQQLVGALPDVELAWFADSGHMPNLEEPERFNALVRRFAREQSSDTAA
jgi:pimeloyl-ACP methyl ester carboxylesterase